MTPTFFRLHFSLRTLLLVLTAVCIGCGLFARYVHLRRCAMEVVVQRNGVLRLRSSDGNTQAITYGQPVSFFNALQSVHLIDLLGTEITDNDMLALSVLSETRVLSIGNSQQVTDRSIDSCVKMKRLMSLTVRNTSVSDKGIAPLASLHELRELDISGTAVSDASVVEISKLGSLQYLHLRSSDISSKGAARISKSIPGVAILYD